MLDMNRNITEARLALTEKPLKATSVERLVILNEEICKYEDLTQPERFAKMLSSLLDKVSVPLEEYDLIAGRCVDRELTETEEQVFKSYLKNSKKSVLDIFLESGHCTYSWEYVVERGMPGLREDAKSSLREQKDRDKQIFLTSIIDIYDAMERYMLRYAKEARKKNMLSLANNLEKAALGKPDSFVSALQLVWIITLIDSAYITPNPTLTVGRLDQILFSLYKKDIEEGRLTREEAAAYITDYYCKHNLIMGRGEHQVGNADNSTTFDRIYCFDSPSYLLLAGTGREGESAVNDLTLLFAECIQPSFKNPVVVVRYFRGMNEKHKGLWNVLMDKALKSSSLMFYNDNNVIDTYMRMGIPEEDARKYEHFGCNWPGIGDNGAWMSIGPHSSHYHVYESTEEAAAVRDSLMRTRSEHSWTEDFVSVMRGLTREDREDISIEDFYKRFFALVAEFSERKLEHFARELQIRKRRPAAVLSFGDCFYRSSVANGECISAGAKYYYALQSFLMFGTVVDCFIVVDELVFQKKTITLTQLLNAIDDNFVGHENVLAMCRNVSKYGSDTPFSNRHAKRISETFSAIVIDKNKPYLEKMGLFLEPCIQSDTHHLKMGERFGATPDGRLAHTPFSQNARPTNGACVSGLTGMLNSMLQIPSDGILSGALNLDLDMKQFEGEQGKEIFGALLGTYFNRGGLHAQVSSVNPEDLKRAQIYPEQYRDLRVRVTGYSGVYVDICKRLQDDIIKRFE